MFAAGFEYRIWLCRNICFESSVLVPPVVSDVYHFVFSHYVSHVNELFAVSEEFVFHLPSHKSQ